MNENKWEEVTPNEKYKEEIHRLMSFVDKLEDNHTLACIYTFINTTLKDIMTNNSNVT